MSGYRRCYTLGILNGFSFRENESTRRAFNLLSLEHQELVGAGFCTPDFVLATGELPRGHIGSRSGRARISPSRGVEARPGSRPSRCLTPISLIDTDGVRLGPIDRQVPVRPALGFLRWMREVRCQLAPDPCAPKAVIRRRSIGRTPLCLFPAAAGC